MPRLRSLVLALAVCLAPLVPARATVFYARDEALKLAFPDADRVEARDLFLTAAQRQAIEQAAKSKLESDLLTVYIGHRGSAILGYAIFDTHNVRTLPETFLVVLTPDGKVAATHLLAFYEPMEYAPPARWLEQFRDQTLSDDMRVGRGIATITGSTLTSEAVTGGIRRALAIYQAALKGA
ncbi:MAG: FMN-binding protein [Deltaproteobacteria bacterium]|nr:FMN-binding protein [Deltaproteobacteria bacterium]